MNECLALTGCTYRATPEASICVKANFSITNVHKGKKNREEKKNENVENAKLFFLFFAAS